MSSAARSERREPHIDDASRAPEVVARAVDEALMEARKRAASAQLPLEGDSDTLALLSACDVDDELDAEACEVLARVLRWLDQVEQRDA
jgi:type III secretion system FlhB-like substrate exporter